MDANSFEGTAGLREALQLVMESLSAVQDLELEMTQLRQRCATAQQTVQLAKEVAVKEMSPDSAVPYKGQVFFVEGGKLQIKRRLDVAA